MCGFAGVVTWDERYRTSRETLARMSAAVAHRGPDGEGQWFNHEAEITPDRPQAALAHRRLAILDPDPRANQPFTDGQGRWLVFNGEIYNFRELRQELTSLRPEYEWRTNCDTEVLLVAYAVWGEQCVEHLNGMFAFAAWDENAKTLFLARDRMGQKPLYISGGSTRGAIAFASEPAALERLSWVQRERERGWLVSYLRYGNLDNADTLAHSGQLRPGRRMLVMGAEQPMRIGDYFNPNTVSGSSINGDPSDLRNCIQRAVERQLVSDVPLGVFLSGGIDSSVVASCARRAGPLQTFSISFDDPRYDESMHARAVAGHLGTDHHEFRVTADAVHDLPKLAAVFGEPFADSSALPTHYLARETRKHVKVALSGDGGDELFGGYDRYRAMRLSARWTSRRANPVLARLGRRWADGHPKSRVTRAARFLSSLDLDDPGRYDAYVRLFDDPTISELLGRASLGESRVASAYAVESIRTPDPVRAALATDRVTYLPDDLLTKVDRASMLHALEVRSPFMDHELVQFAAGLTTDQLLKGGPKRMLREAFADDLPAWVFKRKKMGFAVPVGDWFRGELRPMLRDHLFAADSFARGHFNTKVVQRLVDEHEAGRVDHAQRLYALLMLELWWRLQ